MYVVSKVIVVRARTRSYVCSIGVKNICTGVHAHVRIHVRIHVCVNVRVHAGDSTGVCDTATTHVGGFVHARACACVRWLGKRRSSSSVWLKEMPHHTLEMNDIYIYIAMEMCSRTVRIDKKSNDCVAYRITRSQRFADGTFSYRIVSQVLLLL